MFRGSKCLSSDLLKSSSHMSITNMQQQSIKTVKARRRALLAARVFLGVDQDVLASEASVAARTLSQLETGQAEPRESTRAKVQSALERRGIVFTNGDKPGFYFDKTKVDIPT